MKITALLAMCGAALASCSSSSGGNSPSLVGNWIIVNSDGTGTAFDFTSDTYVLAALKLTSSTTANAQVETGTYTSTGRSFAATPTKWTCPGPDPVSTVDYSFQNGNLVLSFPNGLATLQPNKAAVDTSFTITYGCVDKNGTFTPSPLAPVTN